MSTVEDLHRNYRVAFFRYLPRREEAALRLAYEIGRAAVVDQVSVLDLAQVHHQVLLEVLRSTKPDEVAQIATAASEFLLEVLAIYDMAHRGMLRSS